MLYKQMVGSAGHRAYDALHFQLEKDGRELADGDVGLDADDVQLQVVGLLEQADDLLLLRRQVGE